MRAVFLALALLAAPPVRAGTVEDRSAELQRAEGRTSTLEGRIAALRSELDRVAARIETLKAQARRDGGGADRELTELLRRSQALADVLSSLSRDHDRAEAERRDAATALVDACEAELDRLRRAVDAGDAAALQRSRSLDELRTRARAHLSRSLPGAPAPSGFTEDPAELRERADLLRDQRDRVQVRLVELGQRIGELRDRQRIERALRGMRREESLFDDATRVQRFTRSVSQERASPASNDDAAESQAAPPEQQTIGPSSTDSDTLPGAGETGGNRFNEGELGGSNPLPPTPPVTSSVSTPSVSSAPRFGGDLRVGTALAAPLTGRESLTELQSAREALLRESAELERNAAELERRARNLDVRE